MRDLNIAGRDVNVDNTVESERKSWVIRFVSWVGNHIVIALVITIIGGLVVAFIAFKMGWV